MLNTKKYYRKLKLKRYSRKNKLFEITREFKKFKFPKNLLIEFPENDKAFNNKIFSGVLLYPEEI